MTKLLIVTSLALCALVHSVPLDSTEYIVQLKKDVGPATYANHAQIIGGDFSAMGSRKAISRKFKIGNSFKGYSTRLSQKQVQQLKSLPDVLRIVPNLEVRLFDIIDNVLTQKEQAVEDSDMWGLDRINAKKGLDKKYTWTVDGSGVDCYVVDTGIMSTHNEFKGRVIQGASFIENEDTDLHGHGSHVAGIIAGETYGVAKNCTLVPVKVVSNSGGGSLETILAGLSWLSESAKQRKKPSVVNMSLGTPKEMAIDDAVKALVDQGIVVVAAAGNDGSDACGLSPASEPSVSLRYIKTHSTTQLMVITVGSTNKEDSVSYFSNQGGCLDVLAPGEDIKSAIVTTPNASEIMSGTSMASPFVAGVAALYLSANPSGSPDTFAKILRNTATKDAIEPSSLHEKSPNLLVYSPLDNNVTPSANK
ncbi:peptidase S8/S53 domain-containing protein [Paraphysoderma sedebokerense]|nr:peptidase S8/S53 domain-containing protein [Paraphysoderma sedebokerense]